MRGGLVDLRPRTKVLNVGIARNYLVPRFGSWPLNRITKSDVKAMVADEIDHSGLPTSSIRKHVHVLSQILRGAVEDGFIVTNPAEGVKLPVEKRREMRILDPGQVARLADAIGPHYRPMILTAAYSGLRFGELCGLAIEDVDVLRRRITVRQQAQEIDGQMQIVEPKTKASRRVLTVPAALVEEVLAAHLALDPVQRSGMVFPTPSGTIIRPTAFRRVFRRACTAAGLDDDGLDGFRFHELRHTAVALAVAEGAHPLTIKERLGHASITTTMDTYGRLFPSADEALAEALDGTLRESLAASSRPEEADLVHIRRSAG